MWTKWRHLTDQDLNDHWDQSSGVYYIRLVNRRGKPAQIQRVLGADREGTLYIGMAGSGNDGGLCNRLWGFWTAISGTDETQHGAGRKYRRLLSKRFPGHRLQYCFRRLKDAKRARQIEKECLMDYQKCFGEIPPLNRSGVE